MEVFLFSSLMAVHSIIPWCSSLFETCDMWCGADRMPLAEWMTQTVGWREKRLLGSYWTALMMIRSVLRGAIMTKGLNRGHAVRQYPLIAKSGTATSFKHHKVFYSSNTTASCQCFYNLFMKDQHVVLLIYLLLHSVQWSVRVTSLRYSISKRSFHHLPLYCAHSWSHFLLKSLTLETPSTNAE